MAKDKKRRCTARTQKGEQCRNAALKGHMVCIAHAERKVKEARGFGGPQPNSGRPKKLKPMDIERDLMQRYVLAWMRPYWRALGFDVGVDEDGELYLMELAEGGIKIHGESKDGDINMTDYDDLAAQISAAEKLRDRVFGRPKQTTEVSGPGGGKIEVDVTADEVKDAREAFLAAFPGGKVPLAVGGALIPSGSDN